MNKQENKRAQEFNDILSMFDFKQHINSPTHRDGNVLDLMITRNNECLSDCTINYMNSDHNCIKFQINCKKPRPRKKTITSRNMRDIDQEQLKENLRRHFAGKIDKNDNSIKLLNELVALFNDSNNILDRIAPKNSPYSNNQYCMSTK